MRTPVRLRVSMLVVALVTALVAGFVAIGLPGSAVAQTPTVVPQPAAVPAALPVPASERTATTSAAAAVRAAVQARKATTLRLEAVAKHAQYLRVQQVRSQLVKVAKKQIGDRYSAGSSGPNAFDCSGLTRYVYKTVTGKDLPHYSGAQYARVKKIKRSQAQPGDLVFFLRGGAHHVGIYIGNGKMVDAAGYGKGVRVSPISGSWWSRAYTGMGRVLAA